MKYPKQLNWLLALGAALLPVAANAQSYYQETLRVGVKPSCWSDGNCSLDDIVLAGSAFANILIELSAALFFATFIYGGAMYIFSFGKSDWVKKGTDAMKGGAIGMLIVLSAWTIVRYLATAIKGS